MAGYGTLDNCVHLLSTITRPHVAPQWRMQAIKKALVSQFQDFIGSLL